jgi:flagellar FliJ protein
MAKSFQFRLEKVLDVRRMKEEAAQRDLAAAREAVVERNRIILDLMTREDEAKQDLRAMQERAVDVQRLRMAGEFLVAMEQLLRREYETLQNLVRVEIEKRVELTEARKGVRVLERLREKQARLHRQGLDLEERKFLDEIGRRTA